MSIYQRLKDDHRDVKHLLTQLDEKSSRSKLKSALFEELKQMVIAHARAEEKVFYDTLKASKAAHDLVLEGYAGAPKSVRLPKAASAPGEQISDGDANCRGNQQCRERLLLDPACNGVGHPLTLGISLLADFSGLRSRLAGSIFNERSCIPNRGFGSVQNR
jgi:hemerythrin HHE cation binding domain-containing protein